MNDKVFLKKVSHDDEMILYEIFLESRPDLNHLVLLNTAESLTILKQQFAISQMYTNKQEKESRFTIHFEEKCVGKIYLNNQEQFIEVVSIAILPQYRNLGIGNYVLQTVIDKAVGEEKGLKLRVAWYNHEAKRLYNRLGFIETKDCQVYFEMTFSGSV